MRVLSGCKFEYFVTGVCDYRAFVRLVKEASEVHYLPRVSAEVYIFDDEKAVVASSNPTYEGVEENLNVAVFVDDEEAVGRLMDVVSPFWEKAGRIRLEDLPSVEDVYEELRRIRSSVYMTVGSSGALSRLEKIFTE